MRAWAAPCARRYDPTPCVTTPATPAISTARSAPIPPGPAMAELTKIAVFGGVYSNHLSLAAAVDDAQRRGAEACFCLGDLGAFGPYPDRVFPLLRDQGVQCIQGNY